MNTFSRLLVIGVTLGLSANVLAFDANNDNAPVVTPALTADNCIEGQDLNASDVDVTDCPSLPRSPQRATMKMDDSGTTRNVSTGGWEMEVTQKEDGEYDSYVIAGMNDPTQTPIWDGAAHADMINYNCWSKGYHRLRALLQDPPQSYINLVNEGFYGSFYQYQVDRRIGATGFANGLTPYGDHLIKWVTTVERDGTCTQPTYSQFDQFAQALLRRVQQDIR